MISKKDVAMIMNEQEKILNPEHKKTFKDINTHLNLDYTVKKIMNECRRNEKIKMVCEQYINALNTGKSEAVLYESFISDMTNWNYINAVDTELSAMGERIKKYKQDIDLKKILEMMTQTGSYWIVPLIEDYVIDYVNNKNINNKVVLKNRLQNYEFDPFVRDIQNIVMKDMSRENTVYLGESIEKVNTKVRSEVPVSPVEYIKENECVFNIKGIYYVKKGNNIGRANKNMVGSLSESFKGLCRLVNSTNVEFSPIDNTIKVFDDNGCAVISESCITIDNEKVTTKELDNICKYSTLMNEHREWFYNAIKTLNENFNKIATIDFVKRVTLNENAGRCVDVFKLKNNLFINAIDSNLGVSTFYKNVNPIQCRKYINEHMQLNIDEIFTDMLPNQKKIMESIEETKKQYEDYLDQLKEEKKKLEDKKKSICDSKDDVDTKDIEDEIDSAISAIDDEISNISADYKDFEKEAGDLLGTSDNGESSLDDETDNDEEDTDKNSDSGSDKGSGNGNAKGSGSGSGSGKGSSDGMSKDDMEDNYDNSGSGETPDEMSEPIENTGSDMGFDDFDGAPDLMSNSDSGTDMNSDDFDEAPDLIPGSDSDDDFSSDDEFGNVADFDGTLDTPTVTANDEEYKFRVLNVRYNENVKTGNKTGKGEVILVIPSVDANGDIHDETKKVTFYIGPNGSPVINNEYMPLDMYMAIKTSIINDPKTSQIKGIGSENNTGMSDDMDINISDYEKDDNDFDLSGFGSDAGNVNNLPSYNNADVETDNNYKLMNNSGNDFSNNDTDDFNMDDNIAPARRQSPAEIDDMNDKPSYPITNIGVDMEDIRPISAKEFECALTECGIECDTCEGKQNGMFFTISDKSQAIALRNYFKEMKNFTNEEFDSFFPELKKCFNNSSSSIPTMKLESVKVVLPNTKDYRKLFKAGNNTKNNTVIELIAESKQELKYIYNTLNEYNKAKHGNIDMDAKLFLNKYNYLSESKNGKYELDMPYSGLLEHKLDVNNIEYTHRNNNLIIDISQKETKKFIRLVESIYTGKKKPASYVNFIKDFKKLNESVIITIEDTDTGKKTKIDTSKLDKYESDDEDKGSDKGSDRGSSDNNGLPDFNKAFPEGNTTFETKDAFYGSPNEDSDEDNKKTSGDGKDKKKSGIKFKLKKNKNKDSKPKNESVKTRKGNKLNESEATPNVYDNVMVGNRKGQILFQMGNGDFIVSSGGQTIQCSRNDVRLLDKKLDTVECPYKFDPATLKALTEQVVACGMFMNGLRITPSNCYVKYSDFINSDKQVNLIVEGESIVADKQYVRILEDVNNFANINDYKPAKLVDNNGMVNESTVYINMKDYNMYCNSNKDEYPVRTLIKENNSYKLVNVSGSRIQL